MKIITLQRLNNALSKVRVELEQAGFYDPALSEVDAFLVRLGMAYGWQFYRTTGEIHIPIVSDGGFCGNVHVFPAAWG